jgi:type IV pilus assembly protein PilV
MRTRFMQLMSPHLTARLLRSRRVVANQGGFMIIEALIAILIFSLGILGMIAMGGTAIGAQSDARYRTDASRLAENMANRIELNVVRSNNTSLSVREAELRASLGAFAHQASGTVCGAFSGAESANPLVTDWVTEVMTVGSTAPGLPGAVTTGQQIIVDDTAAGFNRVEITVCWKDPGTPAGTPMRRHTLVTFVNGV